MLKSWERLLGRSSHFKVRRVQEVRPGQSDRCVESSVIDLWLKDWAEAQLRVAERLQRRATRASRADFDSQMLPLDSGDLHP